MQLSRNQFIPLLVFLVVFQTLVSQEPELDEPPEEALYFLDRRLKVEFVEKVEQMTYLSEISFEDRYYLDLYTFDQNMKNTNFKIENQYGRSCPKLVFQSLGLTGFNNPILRTGNIAICPNMKSNCCTNNDLVVLETIWKDYFTYIELNHDYFAYYTKTSLANIQVFIGLAEYVQNSTSHLICKGIADSFRKLDLDEDKIRVFLSQLTKLKEFDLTLKKGFRCLLCDYDNNKFVDVYTNSLLFSDKFCVDIVKNSITFYINLRDVFLKFYNSVGMLSKCYANKGTKDLPIFPFEENENLDFLSIKNGFSDDICLKAFLQQNDAEIAVNCKNFCHKFDMWTFEGVLPNIVTMGNMWQKIEDNLLELLSVEVIKPKEEVGIYKFPFAKDEMDIFRNFDFIFGKTGVEPANIREFN